MKTESEAKARIKINKLLEDAEWRLIDDEKGRANVDLEYSTKIKRDDKFKTGLLDYLLFDSKGFPLCVLEAKREDINPLFAKDQARAYAMSQNIRFVILSNGNIHYLWDIEIGNPEIITSMPTQESLEQRTGFKPNTKTLYFENITKEYVALMQNPNLLKEPDYIDESKRKKFCFDNGYRLLRDYQINAIKALQQSAKEDNNRFLFEMATGTGKTLTSAGIIKLFLKTGNAKRVLFLVDRIELEKQVKKNFDDYLKDYTCVIYKEVRNDWRKAEVVITTIQSLLVDDRYKRIFSPTDFDLVISDESHRCIGGNSRAVFEYFIGYKLGLTATPKDYIRNVDTKKLKFEDPKALERRILLDTYKTFGCESGEPTFRYSLLDGVRDKFLINPKVVDARTEITTEILSEKGYSVVQITDDGDEEEQQVFARDFEKKFFSENTNIQFCKTLLENGLKDPISGEFGKTIVFCVSQDHCAKITQILNQMAHKIWEGKYNSDFAVQVTSCVPTAQDMTTYFSNDNLNGNSRFLDDYKSSKTRICVTVGMMTTGYDCQNILNLALMRPIFSPTDFVQIKGRGTRKNTFKYPTTKPTEYKEKEYFKLFDFFANCEYFEHEFNYDEELKLPRERSGEGGTGGGKPPLETLEIFDPDKLKELKEISIGLDGMKIDRELFQQAKETFTQDEDIKTAVNNEDWQQAEHIVKEKYENKPNLFVTLDKLRKSENLDRRLSWIEVLQRAFGLINKFKNQDELLEDECDKYISIYKPESEYVPYIKNFIKAYATDGQFRNIIECKKFQELNFYAGFTMEDYKHLNGFRATLPEYIKDNIVLNKYM
ncbi:MAG: DEAD/DEAH box helicase family protein [Candidatus Gastranaerophilales bacterium]|nr:DEAD/DEAH box helicase family protein [Candidatus Gastranaerophilales bacterium]